MTPSRLLALRLACLADEDRQWLLSRLAPDELMRMQALLDELQDSGLLRDRVALRDVLATVQHASAIDPALVTWLERLGQPVWRTLALHYLEPGVRATLAASPSPSPLARQVGESVAAQPLPDGWKVVLLPPAQEA